MNRVGWMLYIMFIVVITIFGVIEVKSFYDKQAQTFKNNRYVN